jgi:hypothetical protein
MNGANIVATVDATFENTLDLSASVSTDQALSVNLGEIYQSGDCKVLYNTSEYWNSHPQLIAKKGYLYVYSDYKLVDNEDVAGIKVGDGTSYLIDMPFIDKPLDDHIADTVKHITSQERTFWNNKVRCYIDPENEQNLVFTTQ